MTHRNMTSIGLRAAIILVLAPSVLTASDEIPGKAQTHPIAIEHATIHPISSQPLEDATIVFENGKIQRIGSDLELSNETEVIDGAGKHVYPGLIDSATLLGLVEIDSINATADFTEQGFLNPNVRSWVAVNPDSEIIPITRSNGVLTCLVMPEGRLVAGRSAVMNLDGWTWEDMLVKADTGLHIRWPLTGTLAATTESSSGPGSSSSISRLVDLFESARVYGEVNPASVENRIVDLRLESMQPILAGKIPVFIHANELESIQNAVAFAKQQGIRMVIVGGYDAPDCSELLRQEEIPVIVTGTYRLPRRQDEPYDSAYSLPERLRQARVKFCLASQGKFGASGIRNLPYHAAMAVAFGLPMDEGLKAVTLSAAEILGVESRLGSLEESKDATLIVTDGNPLETTTTIDRAYIRGREVDLNNRQKRLYKKYQSKYAED